MYFIGNAVTWRTLALFGIDFSLHKFNQKLNSKKINSIQIILFSGAIPSLVQLVGLFFIPESPRWLVRNIICMMFGLCDEIEI